MWDNAFLSCDCSIYLLLMRGVFFSSVSTLDLRCFYFIES